MFRATTTFILCTASGALLAGVPATRLGQIQEPQFQSSMCELYTDAAMAIPVLLSDIEGKAATLNVDNKNVTVKLASTNKQSAYWAQGETFERIYIHEKQPIKVVFTAGAFEGGEGGGQLEGWPMTATITLGTEALKVAGSCGSR